MRVIQGIQSLMKKLVVLGFSTVNKNMQTKQQSSLEGPYRGQVIYCPNPTDNMLSGTMDLNKEDLNCMLGKQLF